MIVIPGLLLVAIIIYWAVNRPRWEAQHRATQHLRREPLRPVLDVQRSRPAKATPVKPVLSERDRWMADVIKANPGMTTEAAAILYDRMDDDDHLPF